MIKSKSQCCNAPVVAFGKCSKCKNTCEEIFEKSSDQETPLIEELPDYFEIVNECRERIMWNKVKELTKAVNKVKELIKAVNKLMW